MAANYSNPIVSLPNAPTVAGDQPVGGMLEALHATLNRQQVQLHGKGAGPIAWAQMFQPNTILIDPGVVRSEGGGERLQVVSHIGQQGIPTGDNFSPWLFDIGSEDSGFTPPPCYPESYSMAWVGFMISLLSNKSKRTREHALNALRKMAMKCPWMVIPLLKLVAGQDPTTADFRAISAAQEALDGLAGKFDWNCKEAVSAIEDELNSNDPEIGRLISALNWSQSLDGYLCLLDNFPNLSNTFPLGIPAQYVDPATYANNAGPALSELREAFGLGSSNAPM